MSLVDKYLGEGKVDMGRAYDKGLKDLKYAATPEEVRKIIKKYKMKLFKSSKQKAVSGGELENFIIDWDGYRITLADIGKAAVERQKKYGRHIDRFGVAHIWKNESVSEGGPYRGMSVHGLASHIKKKYGRTIKSNDLMRLMAEEGLHGDDDWADMEDALRAVGVKIK